jgi:DNA polymerase III epsilon subunit-like protein
MLVLVLDSETTGLPPKTRILNKNTMAEWPHMVQFSYLVYNTDTNKLVRTADHIIKIPDEIDISEESYELHNISKKMSVSEGESVVDVLNQFIYDVEGVDVVVAHNYKFDSNMVMVEMMRNNMDIKKYMSIINTRRICCTMKESTNFCNIQMISKFDEKPYMKPPKLSELHEKLFGITPVNLHNSLNDAIVTLRCYIKLKLDKDINNELKTIVTSLLC